MTKNSSPLPLRPNVCMLVINQTQQLFIGERHGQNGIWQFPQGGVEDGLTLEENVIKELNEELGADKKHFKILKKLKHTHAYEFRTPPDYAKGRWRGQSQTFWLVSFLGNDSDIDLDKFEPEFSSFRWVAVEELRTIVDPIRLPGYEGAILEYATFLNSSK